MTRKERLTRSDQTVPQMKAADAGDVRLLTTGSDTD